MHLSRVAVWRRIMLFLFLLLGLFTGKAQIYPVELSPQIIPPYSVYLPDYASPGSEKLRIVALQKDLTVPSYRLRLEMKIEINGITIMQTARSVLPSPITLQPGIPTILSGSDLYWYVQPQNLEFGNGYSRSLYEQTRSLPEGPVTISFTAYDYNRNDEVQVSREAFINFYATRDNPPLLNYPACGMHVNALTPQFLNFSWLPQNTSSPNSALQTNYVFSLWPVLPEGYNYQDIVQNSRPLYSITTQLPNLVYGPGEPLLTPGLAYVWRVQAVDVTGKDLFRNNGYSESCTFIYGGDNGSTGVTNYPAIAIKAAADGSAQGKISWNLADKSTSLAAAGYQGYKLYYRKPQGGYDWFSADVADTTYRIFDLEPSTTYEVRLQGLKGGNPGPYTDVVNFTTGAKKVVSCSDAPSLLKKSTGKPLEGALPGMNITYGPWDVQLLTVKALATAGQYSGTCKVTVPFMANMVFNAKFDNLTIDDSRNVTAGNIVFLSQGMKQWIDSSINHQMGGSDYGNVVSGNDTTNVTVAVSLANLDHVVVSLGPDSTISSFTIPGTPPVVVQVNDSLKVVTIKDSNGDTYALDNQGTLTPLSIHDNNLQTFFADAQNLAALDTLAKGKGVVQFTEAEHGRYAFDAWKPFYAQASAILTSQYEKLSGGDGDYYVSQKAIGAGESDIVGLNINLGEGLARSNLVFANGKGDRLVWDTVSNTLNLLGGPAADAQEIYALYPKPGGGYYSLGKLLVSAYEQQQFTAVIVPVVAADGKVPSIDAQQYEDSLNSIYNKVNISWKVETADPFTDASWDADGNKLLTMQGSSFLSNSLTGEPAALVKLYNAQQPADKTRKYIFVLNGSSDGNKDEAGMLTGDMPRGTRYGFIFLDANTGQAGTAITIAHELGHGQFNLEHTFSGDIRLGTKGATAAWPNLEDYLSNNYRHLYKYQWNQVHQPGDVIGILESDTAGQNVKVGNFLDLTMLNADLLYFSFLTPDGKRIMLPKSIRQPVFAYSISQIANDKLVAGTLTGFTIVDGTTETKYSAVMYSNQFKGYFNAAGNEYAYTVPADANKKALVMLFPKSATQLRTVRFSIPEASLDDYAPLHGAVAPIADERTVGRRLKLFSSDAYVIAEKALDADNSLLQGTYNDLNQDEADLIKNYSSDASLLPMLKVAAWKKLYPVYYDRYTTGIENGRFCSSLDVNTLRSQYGTELTICRIWEKNENQDALNALLKNDKYEFYCVFLDSLRNYCNGYTAGRKDVIATLSDSSGWQPVMEAFIGLNDVEMQQLTLPQRVLLLKFAIKKGIRDAYSELDGAGNGFEKVVVRLFKSTPAEQQPIFLDSLTGSRDFDKGYPHLLAALCKDVAGLDGDEWKEWATLINGWILTYKPRTDKFSIPNQVSDKKVLIFDDNQGLFVLEKIGQLSSLLMTPFGSHYSLEESYTDEGKIQASTYKDEILYKADLRSLTKWPYEYIFVYFKEDHTFSNGVKIAQGAILPLPAFMVYSMFNDVNTGRVIVGVRTTVDIALLFLGVGELDAAIEAAEAGRLLYSWKFYKNLADLTMSAADIVISDGLGDRLEKSPDGQKVLYWWNIANMTYSFSRMSYDGIQSLKKYSANLKEAADEYKAATKLEEGSEDALTLEKMETTTAEMAKEAVKAESTLLDAFLAKHSLKGTAIEELLNAAGPGRAAMMIQMGGWEAPVFDKLNAALKKFGTLKNELVAAPALVSHFHDVNTKWWYKYSMLREDYRPKGTLKLPPGFKSSVEDLETLDGVKISTITPNSSKDLGNLFEDDLIEEIGKGFTTGNFDHLPPDVKQKIESLYNQGYTVMVTQSIVDLDPFMKNKPQPDMLFFKTRTGVIVYSDAAYIDVKLNVDVAFKGAQKNLQSISGTNNVLSISGFAKDKNPKVYSTGNFTLKNNFLNKQITISEAGKFGTSYENDIFNITYKQ